MRITQIPTFGVILQGDANPLRGTRETAVHLINLNWGLSLLLLTLAILPHVLIWHTQRWTGANNTQLQRFEYSKLGGRWDTFVERITTGELIFFILSL